MFASKNMDVVDISSSEDENEPATNKSSIASSNPQYRQLKSPGSGPTLHESVAGGGNQTLEERCFWKAGNLDSRPVNPIPSDDSYIEHARVHPKFLHSNATSHKWAFGAIAELLDNAVDEICNGATFVKVNKIYNMKDKSPALLFHDDGGGMDPDQLRKCLSFGYSSKTTTNTIGRYGNGFKTSTMRLGADAIVFSRTTRSRKSTQSIGLLSYTFLCITGQDDVIVPMVDFDISNNWAEPIVFGTDEDWSINMKNILEWSPFASQSDLMLQFNDMGSHGTKIIIYNLWQNDEGIFELNFDDDEEDIQLRDESASTSQKRSPILQSHISYRLCFSLRVYISMLYLQQFTNFSIILRGIHVQQLILADELRYIHKDVYRPQLGRTSNDGSVEITLGFNKGESNPGVSGFNVYHKNRLIKPFWKVSSDSHIQGYSIIGFLEANFIEPAHDKQDFERSLLLTRLESKLKQILTEYWKRHCHLMECPPLVSKERPRESHVYGSVDISGGFVGHSDVLSKNSKRGINSLQLMVNNKDSPKGGVALNPPVPRSFQDISAENIQLFAMCEEHRRKEQQLKQMIEELEIELEKATGSNSQLAALIAKGKIRKGF